MSNRLCKTHRCCHGNLLNNDRNLAFLNFSDGCVFANISQELLCLTTSCGQFNVFNCQLSLQHRSEEVVVGLVWEVPTTTKRIDTKVYKDLIIAWQDLHILLCRNLMGWYRLHPGHSYLHTVDINLCIAHFLQA